MKFENRQLCALTGTPCVVQRVTFIMPPSTATLSHTNPTSAEIYRDSHPAQGQTAHVSRHKGNMTFSSMELGPLQEAASLAYGQEILDILWNPKIY